MKIKKLTMQAFGSYVEETTIDFNEINGLFLISGPTGSGKTTIFDAICFALYGQSSGQYSGNDKLRSDAALLDVETYVKLEFEHQGKDYTIRRSPDYIRFKDKGEGTTKQDPTATLWKGAEVVATKPTKVNSEIKALIEIDADKFKQIALIAQGEFGKLLNIKSKEREEILRTLFMTEPYQAFEKKLLEKKNAENLEKNDKGSLILQAATDVQVSEEDHGESLVERIKLVRKQKNDPNCDYLKDTIDEIVAVDKTLLDEINNKYMPAQKDLERKIKACSDAEHNNSLVEHLETVSERYNMLASEEKEFKKRAACLQQIKKSTHEIKPLYDNCYRTKEDIASLEKSIVSNQAAAAEGHLWCETLQEKKDAYYTENEQKLLELQKIISTIENDKDKYAERDSLRNEVEEKDLRLRITDAMINKCKVDQWSKELKSLGKEIEEAQEKHCNLLKVQNDLRNVQKKFDAKNKSYNQACRMLENSRAGILAEQLIEGKPCLVCGSLEHPDPAKKPEDAPTEAEVEDRKNALEELRSNKDALVAKAADKKGELASSITNVRHNARGTLQELIDYYEIEEIEDIQEYHEGEDVLEWFNTLKSYIQTCQKHLDGGKNENAVLYNDLTASNMGKRIGGDLDDIIVGNEDIDRQIETLKEDREKINSIYEQQRGTLNAYSTLPYRSWNEAQQASENASKEKQLIENEIESIDKALIRYKEDTAKYEGKVESDRKQKQQKEIVLEEQENKLKEALSKFNYQNIKEAKNYFKEIHETEKEEHEINEYNNNLSAAKKMKEEAEDKAKDKKIVDIEELEREKDEAQNKVNDLSERKSNLDIRIKLNTDKQALIENRRKDYEEAKHKAEIYEKLHKLVTGTGSLSLEHYVQASGFDEIIENANSRFMEMTNGKYKLCRQTKSSDKRSQEFLNLEVCDIMKGTKRGVGSLSGGESFLAALSLALGMSDMISTHQGGISTDFLFIDEGFGTLDADTVESVIAALTSLSQDKLVGVISHREELKQNIEQRIEVEKTPKGSSLIALI